MNWIELLNEIFKVCIVPLLGVLTAYIIKYLNSLQISTNSNIADKYLTMLKETINSCVLATNQTYVDSLKQKNAFTKEAQQEAFNKTYEAVMSVLTDESKKYLNSAVGDLEVYVTEQIEHSIYNNKTTTATTSTVSTVTTTAPITVTTTPVATSETEVK